MNQRNIIIGIIVIVLLAAGGYAVAHRMTGASPSTTPASGSSSKTPATSNAVFVAKTDATLGQYLATPGGKPLYTYGGDSNGVSNCTGECLADWPAYTAASSSASLPAGVSTITRSDTHQMQYTYNGMPLYTFTNDSNGTVTGDGVNNFHIAKPAGSPTSPTPPSSSPSPSSPASNSNPYPY